jgi:cGMP-dependent protein kinase
MTSEQKDATALVLITEFFKKGETIVHINDPASSFYIIKEGTVSVIGKDGK